MMKKFENTEKEVDSLHIFNALPGNYLVLAADAPRFTIVQATDSYLARYNLQRGEVIGKGILEILTAEETSITASLNYVLTHKQEHRIGDQVNKPVFDEHGTVKHIIHAVQEIISQKTSPIESQARSMVELAPVAMTLTRGQEMVIEIINPPMLRLMNKPVTENVVGKTIAEILPEVESQPVLDVVRNVLNTGQSFEGGEVPVAMFREDVLETRYLNLFYTPVIEDGSPVSVLHMAIDVTKQVHARKHIEENEQALQMAIEIAELGTFRVDLITYTGSYSSRIMEWFGMDTTTNDMHTIFAAIHPGDREHVIKSIKQSLIDENNSRHDLIYRVRDAGGKERYLRSFGKAFFDSSGRPYQILGVIQDVTPQVARQRRMEESEAVLQRRVSERTVELENRNTELKRSNDNLEEFAHAASHDLKEPIRKIRVFIGMLKDKLSSPLKEVESELFNRIENSIDRMSLLIEDLLLYSHARERPTEMEAVDLNEQLQLVMEDLELDIQQRHAVINIAHLPVLRGHQRQLQQLFQNLLSNALKYSKPDTPPQIDITASITEEGEQRYHKIAIRDNGIGFNPEYSEKIFKIFARLHSKEEYGGSGVGLSIVKKIVENHAGFIRVESDPGMGSTFQVFLPMDTHFQNDL